MIRNNKVHKQKKEKLELYIYCRQPIIYFKTSKRKNFQRTGGQNFQGRTKQIKPIHQWFLQQKATTCEH